MNRAALALLRCTKWLDVVTNATHLFEEQGALEEAAGRAAGWFAVHLQENRDADPR